MDSLGLDNIVKRRQQEQSARLNRSRVDRITSSSRADEAVKRTQVILEDLAREKRDRELKTEYDKRIDMGEDDGGVKFEDWFFVSPAIHLPRDSDKVLLPQPVLEELTQDSRVRYPLMFELFCESTGKRTHCGVLEFNAAVGSIGLPEKVSMCIGSTLGDRIRVRYKCLSKCRSVTLKVPMSRFVLFPDFKSFLETSLRHKYVTLSIGDQVLLGNSVPGLVTRMEPEAACCLIDADVNVDLEVVEDEELKGKKKWVFGQSETFELGAGSKRLFLDSFQGDSILISANVANADLMVSSPPAMEASRLCFDQISEVGFENFSSLLVDLRKQRPAFLNVGVECGESQVVLTAVPAPAIDPPRTIALSQCSNCRQEVSSIELHSLRCERLIRFCEICARPVRLDFFETHAQLYHRLVSCLCGELVPRYALAEHKTKTCCERLELCRFCGLKFPIGNVLRMDARDRMMGFVSEHEALCGNRTEKCPECGRIERLKDFELHMQAFHSSKE